MRAAMATATMFATIFLLASIALGLAVHALLLRLGAPRAAAFAGAAIVLLSPDTMLFENLLFYEHPIAVALALAALALHRYVSTGALRDGIALFALVAAVPLTRSLFHLVWAVAIAALVLAFVPRAERRRAALLAATCLLLVGGLYLKNLIVFGRFEGSSWFGMNFARIALTRMPKALREEMVREGRLSPLALHRPFAACRPCCWPSASVHVTTLRGLPGPSPASTFPAAPRRSASSTTTPSPCPRPT